MSRVSVLSFKSTSQMAVFILIDKIGKAKQTNKNI